LAKGSQLSAKCLSELQSRHTVTFTAAQPRRGSRNPRITTPELPKMTRGRK
jgi:hypothetical protein